MVHHFIDIINKEQIGIMIVLFSKTKLNIIVCFPNIIKIEPIFLKLPEYSSRRGSTETVFSIQGKETGMCNFNIYVLSHRMYVKDILLHGLYDR